MQTITMIDVIEYSDNETDICMNTFEREFDTIIFWIRIHW